MTIETVGSATTFTFACSLRSAALPGELLLSLRPVASAREQSNGAQEDNELPRRAFNETTDSSVCASPFEVNLVSTVVERYRRLERTKHRSRAAGPAGLRGDLVDRFVIGAMDLLEPPLSVERSFHLLASGSQIKIPVQDDPADPQPA